MQLSFACRLGFKRYDGCQTPVASCEDIQGVEVCGHGFGSGSVALAEYSNFALDLHFGSHPLSSNRESVAICTFERAEANY